MRLLDDMDMMEIGNGALTLKYVRFLNCNHPYLTAVPAANSGHTLRCGPPSRVQSSLAQTYVFALHPVWGLQLTEIQQLSKLNSTQLAIIKNAELLAFSQDTTIGAPAKPYKTGTTPPEYYAGKSVKGTHVFVMNIGSAAASKVVTFSEVSPIEEWNKWTGC